MSNWDQFVDLEVGLYFSYLIWCSAKYEARGLDSSRAETLGLDTMKRGHFENFASVILLIPDDWQARKQTNLTIKSANDTTKSLENLETINCFS